VLRPCRRADSRLVGANLRRLGSDERDESEDSDREE